MSIKQVQIKVQDLTLGMYVSGLDRPWSQTPFPLQGFHVRAPKDIAALKNYCSHVYIDVTKGKGPLNPFDAQVTLKGGEARKVADAPADVIHKPSPDRRSSATMSDFTPTPIPIRKGVYETVVPVRMEAARAEKIIRELKGNLALATKMVVKGKQVDMRELKKNVDGMVASILRCPDAFTWLLRLRSKDQHTHDHTLRSAMWAVQFARYAGMPKDEITILCLGTLLKDVGKVKIPNQILRNPRRTPEEEAEYRKFVEYGVEMLRQSRSIEPRIISVVRYHRERYDGSGFPEGLVGNKIPLLARIAGIATTYDAVVNPRESREPMAPSKAVSLLYNMRDKQFQDDLVVKFIQSIGLYPPGTLVELTSGDIGVVLEQHPESRLTPRLAVLDRMGGDLNKNCIIIDLKEQRESRNLLVRSGRDNISTSDRLAIARDLEPTGYDIDMGSISALFLRDVVRQEAVDKPAGGFFASLKERLSR